jgi:4-carboxymuconolactone decarboxylase
MTSYRPLPTLTPDRLDADQRQMYDAVLASPRASGRGRAILVRNDGSLTGPFDPWMRSPSIGGLLERVGMALRTDVELSLAAREVAILVVAHSWHADFEIFVHTHAARVAGVPNAMLDRVRKGETASEDELDDPVCAAWRIATELQRDRHVDPATMKRALDVLGERAVVEVIMTVGFYGLVSATLDAFPAGPHRPPEQAST